ncbi:MAG: HD domain-containing protein [Gallionella sp.]|nr:HD domain-containing protein [Gallionella sp.]MDD4958750.1 HD domain-containing protein [Gallionella sp.]
MYEHQDILSTLNGKQPLPEKVEFVHQHLKTRFDFIDRVAVAIYDAKTDLLKTFVHSSGGESPLTLYAAKLSDSNSMLEILQKGAPRLVNDLDVFSNGSAMHTQRIAAHQYQSSYTIPMLHNGEFFGFVFFNSYQKNVFHEMALHYLDIIGHLLSLLVIHEMAAMRSLVATVKSATGMTQQRDPETGTHLERMAHYTNLISKKIARQHQLTDIFVEHVFLFAPLHDIGKIGIPDHILHKPNGLTDHEIDTMKTHTVKGGKIVDMMLENLGLSNFPHVEILRNIALYHHESINGTGYAGLKQDEIPIEARIVAVADVFDALTSVRPYKVAWSNDQAFAYLQTMAGSKFDSDCVTALADSREDVERIQHLFKEDNKS